MSRKLAALLGLGIALIPPTIFVCLHVMPSDAFIGLALAMMGGVAAYMHSVALEDVASKTPTTPAADDANGKNGS